MTETLWSSELSSGGASHWGETCGPVSSPRGTCVVRPLADFACPGVRVAPKGNYICHLPCVPSCFSLGTRQDCLGPCSLDGEVFPHPTPQLFDSKCLPHLATECFSFYHVPSLRCLHWLFALMSSPFVVTSLAQVDCVSFNTFFRPKSRDLNVLEALFTAFIYCRASAQLPEVHLPHLAQSQSPQSLFLTEISIPTPLQCVILRFF